MQLTVRRIIVFSIVAMILLFTVFLVSLFRTGSAVTVGRSTTRLTTPLRNNGLPDYAKYVDEAYREGVTPENNAAVLLWKAIWPGELEPEDRARLCDAIGLIPMPSEKDQFEPLYSRNGTTFASEPFEVWEQWLRSKMIKSDTNDPWGEEAELADTEEAEESEDENLEEDEEDVTALHESMVVFPNGMTLQEFDADVLIDELRSKPWKSQQVPLATEWLRKYEARIDLIVEATKRPRYYSPSPSILRNNDELMILQLLPDVHSMRQCARALSLRAMWHLGEGRLEEAWVDTLAGLRLARLVAQGPTMIHKLVGYAIEAIAFDNATAILGSEAIDVELAKRVMADLDALPRHTSFKNSIDQTERFAALDVTIALATGDGRGAEESMSDWLGEGFSSIPRGAVNWDVVLEELNLCYDEFAEAIDLPDRSARTAALQALDSKLQVRLSDNFTPARLLGAVVSKKRRSQLVANGMIGMLVPAIVAVNDATDRTRTMHDLMRISAALAIYRIEKGEYPEQLAALTPGILETVPDDVFSGRPLVYRRRDDGYLLYSVGRDAVDNGGTSFNEKVVRGEWGKANASEAVADGHDIVVREPRPHLRLPWEVDDSAALTE